MSELSEWPIPSLGYPSDVKPNPFLDTSAEQIGPIIPGRFSLSSVCIIPKESPEELTSEVMQVLSDILTSLPPSRTSTPPFNNLATTQQLIQNMTAKLNMLLPLSLSAPKWDGQLRTLRNFLRIMEQLFQTAEITEDQKKLDWITGYVDANIHDQWTSFEEYKARCKEAKLQAGIKPTALCSAIDKENSIESPLDLLYYIYNYCRGYTPCLPQSSCLSANFFVTCCDHDL